MKALETMIQNMFHKDCAACTDQEVYEALLTYTKEQLAAKGYHDGKKKIYYISAEFLIGKLLSNNLINLGLYDDVRFRSGPDQSGRCGPYRPHELPGAVQRG